MSERFAYALSLLGAIVVVIWNGFLIQLVLVRGSSPPAWQILAYLFIIVSSSGHAKKRFDQLKGRDQS